MFKSKRSTLVASVVVVVTIAFANFFTIIEPVVTDGDVQSALWMVAGPIVFTIVALWLFRRYQKNRQVQLNENGFADST